MKTDIRIERNPHSKLATLDWNNLPFGRFFSDHMLVMEYREGAWQAPVIKPYGPISMHPCNATLHYGQAIFEGMKAVRAMDGKITLFRPELNAKRFNESSVRMCMPEIPEAQFIEMISALVSVERDWIPNTVDSSLYLRPFCFAADEMLGVRASDNYTFMIIACPSGPYFSKPVSVKIEQHYTRATAGGTGRAKTAGNYAGSLYPNKLANQEGFDQIIWTDSQAHEYLEESGAMNLMMMIDDVLITPSEDSDTILRSVVKRSVVELAKHWGIKVEERRISVTELIQAVREGRLRDIFGAGTAATIAPIAKIGLNGEIFELPPIQDRVISKRIKAYLDGIKSGEIADEMHWCVAVE